MKGKDRFGLGSGARHGDVSNRLEGIWELGVRSVSLVLTSIGAGYVVDDERKSIGGGKVKYTVPLQIRPETHVNISVSLSMQMVALRMKVSA